MTHILFVVTGLGVGGAEASLLRLVRTLTPEVRVDVVVLSSLTHHKDALTEAGAKVHMLPLQGRKLLYHLILFMRLVRHLRPTHIQGWMYHGNLLAYVAKCLYPKASLLISIRQSLRAAFVEKFSTRFVMAMDAKLSCFADVVIYNAAGGRQDHEEKLGYGGKKVVVMTNGFDTQRFQPNPAAKARLCEELHLEKDAHLIGYVARIHPMKDHATFLRGAALLAQQDPRAHFIVVGEGASMSHPLFEQALEAYPSLKGRLHLLGKRTDLPYLTSAFDVATNTGLNEGLCNALGEALCCGVMCVATDSGDSAVLVGDSGLMIPKGDAQALAKAWQEVLSYSPDVKRVLCARGRARMEETYAQEKMGRFYKMLLEGAGS